MENKENNGMKLLDVQLENVVGGAGFFGTDGNSFCLDQEVQQAVTALQTHVSAVLDNYRGINKTYAEYYSKRMVREIIDDANAEMFRRDYKNLKYCMQSGYPADLQCQEVLALDALMNKYGIPTD